MLWKNGPAIALGALIALSSCTAAPEPTESPAPDTSSETARRLERTRDANRNSPEVRTALSSEYYRLARQAIDAKDEVEYRTYLRKAQDELIAAIRIDPAAPSPHTELGIIRAYQGDLDAARSSFEIALRLLHRRIPIGAKTDGGFYTNIAHIAVYQGDYETARRNLDIGRARGAPPDELDRIETLLDWRSGNLEKARLIFASGLRNAEFSKAWDGAPLPQEMKTFDDFCAVCCRNPSCGPHMVDACRQGNMTVQERERTLETLREEMRLERERQAKLKEIYDRRKDLKIEVEKPKADPAAK